MFMYMIPLPESTRPALGWKRQNANISEAQKSSKAKNVRHGCNFRKSPCQGEVMGSSGGGGEGSRNGGRVGYGSWREIRLVNSGFQTWGRK
nr:hypothetical protein [Tanacetum cinerariifolium]